MRACFKFILILGELTVNSPLLFVVFGQVAIREGDTYIGEKSIENHHILVLNPGLWKMCFSFQNW